MHDAEADFSLTTSQQTTRDSLKNDFILKNDLIEDQREERSDLFKVKVDKNIAINQTVVIVYQLALFSPIFPMYQIVLSTYNLLS